MSRSKSRREFLITAGMCAAVGLLSPRMGLAQGTSAPQASQLRTRKNVASPAAQNDLLSLRQGVEAMKNLIATNPKDPRGWILQAFIHGDCQQFTQCQHGNWYFPPWHRSYIYYFEQLIQFFSNNPAFALPYWDWSRTHGVPASFYGNPLDDTVSVSSTCGGAPPSGRGRSVRDQFSPGDLNTYVGTTVINLIQKNPDFATYGGGNPGRGALEGTPHNFIHRWVGGVKVSNMAQTFSPLDPIFWMHHCNIDRLYSDWLARGYAPPRETAWGDKSFNDFYDKNGNQVGKEFTSSMTVDSKVMGYVYDQLLVDMPLALARRAPAAGKQEVVESVAASKGTLKAGVLSFVTDAPLTANTRQFMNAAAVGTGDYVVRLRIEGVKTPKQQNTGVQVFLGPDVTAETPITAPGYVGSFTFFDGHGEGGHQHDGPSSVLLNASEALKRLYGDTSLPVGANLSVSFVTRALFEGVDAFATVEEIQPDRVQIDVVNLNS